MARSLAWASVLALVYTYLAFPAIVYLRAWLRPRPHTSERIAPSITVIIAARNEARSIGPKLDNLLRCDYPREKMEIIVASDGSDDGTDIIVAAYADQRTRLLSLPRGGKEVALNAAVREATADVLVFSDANTSLARRSLRALVAPFSDPLIGGVAGDQRYLGAGRARGQRSYWAFETGLKLAESRAGNTISATGALYAIRRALFTPLPQGVSDDFATSTGVIAHGFRLVMARDAIAWEPVASTERIEFGRKVRVINRGIAALLARRQLLDPRRHGWYAVQLLSHKVFRRLMAFPLIVLAITTPMLWSRALIYRLMAITQAVAYGCAIFGLLAPNTPLGQKPAFALPAFFCAVNAASLVAFLKLLRGQRIDRWEPQRPTH